MPCKQPRLAPRASRLTLSLAFLILAFGGIAQAQSHPLTSGTYSIVDSSGSTIGTVEVTASSTTGGTWKSHIGGVENNGSYSWNAQFKVYRSFRNTDPPSPVADVWWDSGASVWRWRDIVTGQTGTLH